MLVEGLFDVHQLRTRGVENVAALGGTGIRTQTFEGLSRLGIERLTLCLDRDKPGRAATHRAVEQAVRAARSPAILVVEPDALAPAKDPDAFVREHGVEAWGSVLAARTCGIVWRALEFARDIEPSSDRHERRDSLGQAGAWIGSLPARLALEQEDAVRAVAAECGYSPEAALRALRARYWPRLSDRAQSCHPPREVPSIGMAPEL